MDDKQKIALCSAIRTARYSRKVVSLLRDMADNLYKTDSQDLTTSLEHSMDEDLLAVLKGAIQTSSEKTPMEAEARLREVIEYIRNLEEVSFVIPIHPNKEFVKRLHDWCTESIRRDILIDFTVNRLMESGVLMIYKGHYFEYSLENLLDEYFSTHNMDKIFKLEM